MHYEGTLTRKKELDHRHHAHDIQELVQSNKKIKKA